MVEYSEQSEVSVLHNNSVDELAFIKETIFHFTSVSVQDLLYECCEHEGLDSYNSWVKCANQTINTANSVYIRI